MGYILIQKRSLIHNFVDNFAAIKGVFGMLNSLCIQLKAINAEQNVFRQYEIFVGTDLLNRWS
jgi:hypothetical protein